MALDIQLAIVNGTRGKRETEDSGLNMQPPRTKHILDRMTVFRSPLCGKTWRLNLTAPRHLQGMAARNNSKQTKQTTKQKLEEGFEGSILAQSL